MPLAVPKGFLKVIYLDQFILRKFFATGTSFGSTMSFFFFVLLRAFLFQVVPIEIGCLVCWFLAFLLSSLCPTGTTTSDSPRSS